MWVCKCTSAPDSVRTVRHCVCTIDRVGAHSRSSLLGCWRSTDTAASVCTCLSTCCPLPPQDERDALSPQDAAGMYANCREAALSTYRASLGGRLVAREFTLINLRTLIGPLMGHNPCLLCDAWAPIECCTVVGSSFRMLTRQLCCAVRLGQLREIVPAPNRVGGCRLALDSRVSSRICQCYVDSDGGWAPKARSQSQTFDRNAT